MNPFKTKKANVKRSSDAIRQEYAQLCAQIGENSSRIRDLEKHNTRLLVRIEQLAPEMDDAVSRETAAKAEAPKAVEAK